MKYYNSPRWSGEILDCSMPMTFDTYSHCSFNCLYCFAYFQKSHTMKNDSNEGYQKQQVSAVNHEKVKRIFNGADTQFKKYVSERKVMQWGGMSDPFDMYEKKHGETLKLLKFFKDIDYPLCFSTKGIWWIYDERYRELFRNQTNWNVKISIINLDAHTARIMEKLVPSPMERLEAIKELVSLNVGGVTLRLRPFIIGLTDKNNEYLDVIRIAGENGASALSTEFFCLEGRADKNLKSRYKEMSGLVGFDILKFYRRHSTGSGYLRLNREIKKPYIDKIQDACKKAGLRVYVSDAHFKERCENGSCCGLNKEWNYSRGQFTEALLIAKKNGFVKFSDIEKDISQFKDFLWQRAEGFNTGSVRARVKRNKQTMYDYIRGIWNSPNDLKSPYKYFGGVLIPTKLDNNGDVIYKYTGD